MAQTDLLRDRLGEARKRTDELFSLVVPEALFARPVPERHRLNFYIGHVEAFDANMICGHALGMGPVNAEFDQLFAFGIDPDSSDLPADTPEDWPGLAETRAYCRQVRRAIDEVFHRVPEDVARVCIEHRLMHAETLCYLLHNLDPAKKLIEADARLPTAPPSLEIGQWIEVPRGTARLGRPHGTGFGWDNEFGEVVVDVPAFDVRKHKVTNGEYLAYVNDGGPAPHYWRKGQGGWMLRTMSGEIPLPLDWPVYLTHMEAREYARKSGAELPTEAQWDRAAFGSSRGPEPRFPWGSETPALQHGNVDFARWDPCPVTASPCGDSDCGVSQMLGNGWEWTSDHLRPFPGFEAYPFYPDYSAAFFDDTHYVLKGGSPRTALPLLRRTFRNWFREGYPYVYATLRLVRN